MFKMIGQAWAMLTVLFASGERTFQHLGNAVVILAEEAEKAAKGFADENEIERQKALKLLEEAE